jgi:hypothetical protein
VQGAPLKVIMAVLTQDRSLQGHHAHTAITPELAQLTIFNGGGYRRV